MNNAGGPYSLFEKDLNKRIKTLTLKIQKIEYKIKILIEKSLRRGTSSNTYWKSVEIQINTLYKELSNVFSNWSITNLPIVYRNGLRNIYNRISLMKGITNIAKKGIIDMIHSRSSSQIVKSLYLGANDSYIQSLISGKKNLLNLIRTTQQTLINESILDITTAIGFDLGNLRKAARVISSQFSDMLNSLSNNHFVQAGSKRFTPSYYAELVARTKFHQAQSLAALSMANNYDTDLVQVSSHNTTTEICQQYEGKIFSISGKDKRFPILDNSSPFHPNCLHLMFPTFESAMVVQGTLDSFSSFSLGKIDKPPVPSGFIPIVQRKVT